MTTHYIEPEAGITACCSRTPFELAPDQRITCDQAEATCAGRVTTYEEWRVTGTWPGSSPSAMTWSQAEGDADPEGMARRSIAAAREHDWTDGPHLHKRTVTITEWTEVDA